MASRVMASDPPGGVGIGVLPGAVGVGFARAGEVGVVDVLLERERVGLPPTLPQLAV